MSENRIALFLPALGCGGVERVMLNLAGGLAGRGFQVDLLAGNAEGEFRSQAPKGVRLVDLGKRRVLATVPALVRYLRRERPSALLSAMDYTNLAALWARRVARVPTRVVVSVHGMLSREARAGEARAKRVRRVRFLPFLVRRFYPWADAIVAVSQGVADDVARVSGLPRSRIQVIYNPVITPELFARLQAPLEHPWFQASAPPVVLAAGRLAGPKDFATVLRAFAQVRRSRPARLLILGEGKQRGELEALAASLGIGEDVALPGYIENPLPYMAQAAVFVLSSYHEALGLVLVEAMAAGAPLVATDCESGPREVLEGGKRGRLAPVGNPGALAEAILDSLKQPRQAPATESLKRFELSTALDSYVRILVPQGPSC